MKKLASDPFIPVARATIADAPRGVTGFVFAPADARLLGKGTNEPLHMWRTDEPARRIECSTSARSMEQSSPMAV